ncbi:MAG: RnfABCDGE type electron transport complex subunit D [Oscillospiraceae bacterium]|nr:RnfABCDGE type electron transport complex subunit D [Oscillospiraceae bacterium]
MSNKFIVEPAPHIRSGNTTSMIMLHVIIALTPALIASVIIFGARALLLTITCVTTCVICEYFFRVIAKREQTVTDLSAVVTGMILAFNLPVTLPLYMAALGSVVAIVLVKQAFGGIGQNFANPAAVGRIVLMLSFPSHMSSYAVPFYYQSGIDIKTSATPLGLEAGDVIPSVKELFFGIHGGSLGETCAFALLLGFAYLLVMKIVRPIIPIVFVGTVAIGTAISGGDAVFSMLSGGLLLGAIFMATDYTTNPMTLAGKVVFAVGCGVITLVIRLLGSMPEGVVFSILVMNILTPYIDKMTRPRPLGMKKTPKEPKEDKREI